MLSIITHVIVSVLFILTGVGLFSILTFLFDMVGKNKIERVYETEEEKKERRINKKKVKKVYMIFLIWIVMVLNIYIYFY